MSSSVAVIVYGQLTKTKLRIFLLFAALCIFVHVAYLLWPAINNFGYSAAGQSATFKADDNNTFSDELTIVTAFFHIGKFMKGASTNFFTPERYHGWMTIFARIESHLIAFVDTEEEAAYFKSLRSHLPSNRTLIVQLVRKEMWSFGLIPNISEIFRQPNYPQHLPNTVNANYSASMHAKYDVMEMALKSNPFRTKYFCWLDIGYFRDIVSKGNKIDTRPESRFALHLPTNFNRSRIAVNQVNERDAKLTAKAIVNGNRVWIGGGFFLGRWDVMRRWVTEYKAATEQMIKNRIMSTDQQVIYTMFNTMSPETELQLYKTDGRYSEWFYLGYLAKEAASARAKSLMKAKNETEIAEKSKNKEISEKSKNKRLTQQRQ